MTVKTTANCVFTTGRYSSTLFTSIRALKFPSKVQPQLIYVPFPSIFGCRLIGPRLPCRPMSYSVGLDWLTTLDLSLITDSQILTTDFRFATQTNFVLVNHSPAQILFIFLPMTLGVIEFAARSV